MTRISLVFGWICGLLFLIIGFATFNASAGAGVAWVLMSLIVLPPAREFAFRRTNRSMPNRLRPMLLISLVIFGGVVGTLDQIRNDRVATTTPTIQKANQNIPDQKQAELEKAEYTQRLLAELKTIPVSQTRENLKRYQILLKLHPQDAAYRSKVDFYKNQGKADQETQQVAVAGLGAAAEKASTNTVVGEWLDVVGSSWKQKLKIVRRGTDATLVCSFASGVSISSKLISVKPKSGERFRYRDAESGYREEYVGLKDGNLALYDREGYIRTARKNTRSVK